MLSDRAAASGSRRPSGPGPDGLTRRHFIGRAGATIIGTAGAGGLLAACGGSSNGSSGSKGGANATFLLIIPPSLDLVADLVADAGGYFTKHGLNVTIQQARGGSPQAIQAMISGKGMMARLGLVETTIDITTRHAPLIAVSQIMKGDVLSFASSTSRKPIRTPADFRGTTIGLPSAGGTSETTLDLLLQSAGLPKQSVKTQVIGPPSAANYQLVKQGRIDGYATTLEAAVVVQAQNSDAVILNPTQFVTLGQAYVTTKQQLKSNRQNIQRYLQAIDEAVKFILADASSGYHKTIATLKKKYSDLPDLDNQQVVKATLDRETATWTLGGKQHLLKNIPSRWEQVYHEVVQEKLVKPGLNPAQWYTNELLT